MSCEASYFNSVAGLHLHTWSGLPKQNGNPTLVCTIDDQAQAWHFVEIHNAKTYSRAVYVKSYFTSAGSSAKFDVGANQQVEWKGADKLGVTIDEVSQARIRFE